MGSEGGDPVVPQDVRRGAPAEERAVDAETSPPRGWAIFLLFTSIGNFGSLVSFTFGVMLPAIRQELHFGPAAAGLLAAIFNLFNAFLAVPISNWFSRYNPVRLVAFSGVVGAIFLLLQASAWNFASLFAFRFIFALFQSIKQPARTLLVQQWLALRHIGLANGIGFFLHGLIQTFGIAIAAVVVISLGGWRETYVMMSIVMAVQVVIWLAVARQRRTASFEASYRSQQKTPLGALSKYKAFWIMAVGVGISSMPWAAFLSFLPTFLIENRDMSLSLAGRLTSLLYGGVTVGSLAVGFLDRRVRQRRSLVAGSGVLLLVCPLVLLNTSSASLIATLAFVNGLGWGVLPVLQTMPYHLPGIKPREIAVLTGLLGAASGVGFGFGSLLAGVIAQATGSLYASLLALSCLPLAIILAGLLYPERAPLRGGPVPAPS
ncbi:MAG: MFS transporter [Chloroflexi bacterium]|nr:MFS transporter [Chloroflexota bacterium]